MKNIFLTNQKLMLKIDCSYKDFEDDVDSGGP